MPVSLLFEARNPAVFLLCNFNFAESESHDPENLMALQSISASAESLAISLKRVGDEILEPHRDIQVKTQQLKNLQASTEVLRLLLQSIKLTQRLKVLMRPGWDSLLF